MEASNLLHLKDCNLLNFSITQEERTGIIYAKFKCSSMFETSENGEN